jgi:hypothetical protein
MVLELGEIYPLPKRFRPPFMPFLMTSILLLADALFSEKHAAQNPANSAPPYKVSRQLA